jgi:hypothetical protein
VLSTFRHPATPSNDLVAREVTVLRTLAHVGWLTTDQLHALCFPGDAMATVRTTLRSLEDAGWICHARWRIKSTSGSNVWGIGYKGPFILSRYGDGVPPRLLNLTRPSTAIEHEEWYVRLQARLLLVRLILCARQTALLAHLDATFTDADPIISDVASGGTPPDAVFMITWAPPIVQRFDWLPWLHRGVARPGDHTVRYAVFFDRTAHLAHPMYAPGPQYRLDTIGTDHMIIVVSDAAHIARVQQTVAQQAPSAVVVAWTDIAQQVGHVLHHLQIDGYQPYLPLLGGTADEQ